MIPGTQLRLLPAPQSQCPRARYKLKTATVMLDIGESNTPEYCRSPHEAVAILLAIYRQLDADQEHFVVLCLNNHNRITGYKVIASGGQNQTTVDAKMIYRFALLFGAAAIIVAHNHPSGDPTPSSDDLTITRQLKLAADTLAITFFDHIILEPAGHYYSLADHRQIPDSPSETSD